MITPQFKHDCEKCVFLGQDTDQDKNNLDMYFCSQDGMPTIIARASDIGEDYSSYPIIVINENLDTFAPTPFLRNLLIAEDLDLFDREKDLKVRS